MKEEAIRPISINTVQDLTARLTVTPAAHPLINVVDLHGTDCIVHESHEPLVLNLYSIWLKKGVSGQMKYGEGNFDFGNGNLIFMAPGQVLFTHQHHHTGGWGLFFHPDLLKGWGLSSTISSYDFFLYSNSSALHLSEEEERALNDLLEGIKKEIKLADRFSHEVIVTQLELLLKLANRYYHREDPAKRKPIKGLLAQAEALIVEHLSSETMLTSGPPTVQLLADRLHMSANHLSEHLKSNSGISASEYVAKFMLKKAKDLLTTTTLSASQIAYLLGYQYPQSFSKSFKKQTGSTPVAYRKRFLQH